MEISIKTLLLFSVLHLLPASIQGEITGFQPISGEISPLVQNGTNWSLISGQKSIVEWAQFSLGKEERFHFQQFDTNSAILNRVIGPSASEIFGHISSNGQVIFINPNGILIGNQARIETASFIGSTFDLDYEQFMSGKYDFNFQNEGRITNLGTIECPTGKVLLLARQIANHGNIHAPQVILQTELGDLIGISSNSTSISPYEAAICNTGLIEGDEVLLWSDGSSSVVSGEILSDGGKIHLFGNEIHLINGALLDASSPNRGGEILLGGDHLNQRPGMIPCKEVQVDPGVCLKADAKDQGNGGNIIVWSDELTSFHGNLSARGGKNGGNGGHAEISSHEMIDLRDFLSDLSAPLGETGMLLIDPNDVVIAASATTGTFINGTYSFVTGTATNQILNTDLQNQLANNSVTIMTVGSAGSGPNNGSITVSGSISWSSNNNLFLIANSFVTVGAAITNTGSGSLTLNGQGNSGSPSHDGLSITSPISLNGGSIFLSGQGAGSPVSGVFIQSSVTSTSGSIIFSNCVGSSTSTGSCGVNLSSSSGIINAPIITATNNIKGGNTTGGNSCIGFNVNGGTVGGASSDAAINITATGAGTGQFNHGIAVIGTTGSILTRNGSITLNGTSTTSTATTINMGVVLGYDAGSGSPGTIGATGTGTVNITGSGGGTASGGNFCFGIFIYSSSLYTTNGTMNLTGNGRSTSGGSAQHGMSIEVSGTVTTKGSGNIIGTFTGGANGGASTNGLNIQSGGVLAGESGSTGTITVTGTSGASTGAGCSGVNCAVASSIGGAFTSGVNITGINLANNSSSYGIFIDGTVQVKDGGTLSMTGNGSTTSSAGSSNNGIQITGSLIAGTAGGTSTTTVNLTGTGGTGSGGSHIGVNLAGTFSMPAAGVGAVNNINFTNCSGGGLTGTGGNSNVGIQINSNIAPAGTSTITFSNITGGGNSSSTSASCYGVNLVSTKSLTATTITATGVNGGAGTGNNNFGFYINGVIGTTTTSSLNITAGSLGTGSGAQGVGIYVDTAGTVRVGNAGTMTLTGTGAPASTGTSSHGVWFLSGGSQLIAGTTSSSTANVTLIGTAGSGTGGNNDGVVFQGAATFNGTGTFWIKNPVAGSAAGGASFGLYYTGSLTATNGTVTISGARGGTGGSSAGCYGVVLNGGSISCTTFTSSDNLGGTSSGNNNLGFYLTSTQSLTASGNATIVGTGGGSGASAGNDGIKMDSTATITCGGTLTFTGVAGTGTGAAGHMGVNLNAGTITATVPNILFTSCTGSASNVLSYGVEVSGVNLTATSSIRFTNCVGGSGASSTNYGVHVNTGRTVNAPTITALGIQGGSGSGVNSNIGFYVQGATIGSTSTPRTISITATSRGTGTGNVGIQVDGAGLIASGGSDGANSITLIGTGASSSSSSHGIFISNTSKVQSAAAPISVAGAASGTGANVGVSLSATNSITSTSGNISISGTSSASGASSYGISIVNGWTTGTSGTTTFGASISDAGAGGSTTISGCTGGSGSTSHGINVGAAFSTSGTIVATNSIQGGSGSDSSGFVSNQNFSTTGASSTLTITASGTGSSGVCNGISLTGGAMSTVGGAITLTGTGSASSGASVGILLSSANAITSTTGSITLIGTSNAIGANTTAYGVSLTAAQSPGTSGSPAYSITGTGGATSSGINLSGAITSLGGTGAVSLTGTAGSGASFANNLNANITTTGGTITISGSSILATSVSLDSTNAGGTAAGASIAFSGSSSSINGTAAGAQALTLRAGTNGAITFGAALGATTRLGAVTITSAKTTANAVSIASNITANSFSMSTSSPTILAGTSIITTSANNGVIAFGSTIDATLSGVQGLSLISGSGVITLPGAIGTTASLASFSATSSSAITLSANITTSGSSTGVISFPGAGTVTLATGPIMLSAGTSLSFGDSISGPYSLIMTAASGGISVAGSTTLSGTAVGQAAGKLIATATGDILFTGNIATKGGLATGTIGPDGGMVTLASSGGSVSVASIDTSGTNDVSIGGSAGNITLQPAAGITTGSLGNIPNGRIILNGNLTANGGTGIASGNGGIVGLGFTGRSQFPSIATIVSSFSGNSVTISANSLQIGTNEVMTIFGDINCTLTSSATVGDMIALNSLTISAPVITLVGHGTVQILSSNGALTNITGGHILARTTISAPVTSVVGSLNKIGLIGISDQTTLQNILTYAPSSYILNYGIVNPAPAATTATSPISREELIYQLGVASISFESMLPLYSPWKGLFYFGKICPKDLGGCPDLFFRSFLPENNVVQNNDL